MKSIILAILILTGVRAQACGLYQVKAQVQLINGYPRLVIYPETQSEINLSIKFEETPQLSAYIDGTVSAQVHISSVDATLGNVDKIENIQRIFTNPLSRSQGTDIRLINYEKCKK